MGFTSMLVSGLPEQLTFGGAVVHHTLQRVTTNFTSIVQQPGLGLEWVKEREENVEVGAGVPKLLVHIPFDVSANLVLDFGAMRERALGVAGALVALLDERIAQAELFEDVLLVDPESDEEIATFDAALRVRGFLPRVFTETEEDAVESRPLTGDIPPRAIVASRWYLKGAQIGPTLDSIIFFWVGIEALIPQGGKDTTKQVENALIAAGVDPDELPIPVGRLYGLRADVVHKGREDPDLLREGHYVLEQIVRTLIRQTTGLQSTWPAFVGLNDWPEPLASQIDWLRERSRTHWVNRPDPG